MYYNVKIIELEQGIYAACCNYHNYWLKSIISADGANEAMKKIKLNFLQNITINKNIQQGWSKGTDRFEFIWVNKPKDDIKEYHKPKVYQLIEETDGNGNKKFSFIKHSEELLDEDELKLKLFAETVNN